MSASRVLLQAGTPSNPISPYEWREASATDFAQPNDTAARYGYFLAAVSRTDYRGGHSGTGLVLVDKNSGQVFEAWAEDCKEVNEELDQ